ncbi:hypothetical protein ABMA27_012958 [Loxostege sticticalis]|uniref:Uncharacterized protein n=1 Tax=Loxostege sticticalis TaxID=481309 RepID=A0ABR3IDJ4_LOXSC
MPSSIKQDTTVRLNCRISPIHTDESDVDLSDSDPTFKINEYKPLSSGSESSSDSPPRLDAQNQNTDEPNKKMRKPYVSITKKQVPARSMKNPCTGKCRLNAQKKSREAIECDARLPNNAFYFTVNVQRIRVCRQFYINTLDISDRQIRTKRGKHDNRKRINSDVLQDIKDHIKSIPRIESHYLKSKTDKEYISDGKTIKELCNDFNKQQRENNRTECDNWLYINTFNKDFNIGVSQPKKDRCETCLPYELAPLDEKII